MAYPTNTLSVTLEDIDRRLIQLKRRMQGWAAQLATPSPAPVIMNVFMALRAERSALGSVGATPGLAAYAKGQKNDSGLDIAAEFATLLASIDAVTAWVTANLPRDKDGWLLVEKMGADEPQARIFSAAETSALRTLISVVVGNIE